LTVNGDVSGGSGSFAFGILNQGASATATVTATTVQSSNSISFQNSVRQPRLTSPQQPFKVEPAVRKRHSQPRCVSHNNVTATTIQGGSGAVADGIASCTPVRQQ
jgi:hypothetical protein